MCATLPRRHRAGVAERETYAVGTDWVKGRRTVIASAALVVAASATIPLAVAAAADEREDREAAVRVTARRLAAPDGSCAMTMPLDVNRYGQVIGTGRTADGTLRSFLWDGGGLRAPRALPGGRKPLFQALNDRGQIAGYDIAPDGTRRLALWERDGTPHVLRTDRPGPAAVDLNARGEVLVSTSDGDVLLDRDGARAVTPPEPPTMPGESFASRLNNRGQVIGYANSPFARGFLWQDGKSTYVDIPGGTESVSPLGINDRGQVVVDAYMPGKRANQPFLWRNGTAAPLAGLGGSAPWVSSYHQSVNERGDVVGSGALPGGDTHHGILWTAGRPTDLGSLGGDSTATALNARRDVTGSSETRPGGEGRTHAFLWRDGRMHDLGVPEGYVSSQGLLLTERGAVLGTASREDGTIDAFLWTVRPAQ